jgi:hypothetical protein
MPLRPRPPSQAPGARIALIGVVVGVPLLLLLGSGMAWGATPSPQFQSWAAGAQSNSPSPAVNST